MFNDDLRQIDVREGRDPNVPHPMLDGRTPTEKPPAPTVGRTRIQLSPAESLLFHLADSTYRATVERAADNRTACIVAILKSNGVDPATAKATFHRNADGTWMELE